MRARRYPNRADLSERLVLETRQETVDQTGAIRIEFVSAGTFRAALKSSTERHRQSDDGRVVAVTREYVLRTSDPPPRPGDRIVQDGNAQHVMAVERFDPSRAFLVMKTEQISHLGARS